MNLGRILTLATLTFTISPFASADGAASLASAIWAADVKAGAELYTSQCMSCHGVAGNSLIPAQPILAGQHPEYLAEQLHEYKEEKRINAIMYPFVSGLTDADIANVSAYLAQQNAGLSGATDAELVQVGELLYRNGNPQAAVPNCTGCHGPAGEGIGPVYPRLSGQHADYTVTTLKEFRAGTRVNEAMNDIAAGLSDEDITALAQYISGLY